MSKKKIFLIVGRTCAGKTSIAEKICEDMGLVQVQSYTTRPIRPNETEKSDHIFINESDVSQFKQEDIAAYTEIKGHKYFTTKNILRKSDIYVIDPVGINYLRKTCGNEFDFRIIYVHTLNKTAILRSMSRGDKDVDKRMKDEKDQFLAFEEAQAWDYELENNGTFYEGVDKMEKILMKEGIKHRE